MPTPPPDVLVAYIDGGSRGNPGPAGFGVHVEAAAGAVVHEFCGSVGVATNNVAEYRGLLAALDWAAQRGERRLHVRSDSELLVRQMRGEYRVKNPGLQPLHQRARALVGRFDRVTFEHVPRELNRHADRLANLAMDGDDCPPSGAVPTPSPAHHPTGAGSRDDNETHGQGTNRQGGLPFDDHLPDNSPHSSDPPRIRRKR